MTHQAIKQITSQLDIVFAPMDAEVLESSQAWVKDRVAALKEFKASDEYQVLRRDSFKLYAKLFAIAGGKTWYNIFSGRSTAMMEEFVVKNCAATVAKRNATIANKLVQAGVTDVIDQEFAHTNDGFNGYFNVNTDVGVKRVIIETIRAGGHNIQCLHLRVLVKVK